MIQYIFIVLCLTIINVYDYARATPEKIGIVSGAGPMAGCKLYEKIISICQDSYGCKDDKDFPEMVIISYPFSDMLTIQDRQSNKNRLLSELQNCFDRFAHENIKISAIACNTLHTILSEGVQTTKNFVHIVDSIRQYAQRHNFKKLLILGTQTTLELNLYSSASFESVKPNPEDQRVVDKAIHTILEGTITESDAQLLRGIIASYITTYSIDGVVLGCTELPLLHEAYSLVICDPVKEIPVLDTLEIIAEEMVKKSFGF